MSNSTSSCGGSASGGSGALSLMGCVREASPPPQENNSFGMGEFNTMKNPDTLPKEPKKRRFHPLRGLRRIFRRKSRGVADGRINTRNNEGDGVGGGDIGNRDREEITLGHPAGRADETRSRSASELLTDSCDRQSVFLRHRSVEDSFAKLRVGSGQLSVSHDSVFPGEVSQTRPLSSLDTPSTIERRQSKASDEAVHRDYNPRGAFGDRISLRVLEQIKTAIESRNQVDTGGECYQQETSENRTFRNDKRDEDKQAKFKVTRVPEEVEENISEESKEELPELEIASLSHNAAHHRISVRPKNRRPPKRTITTNNISLSTTISETSDAPDSLELFTPIGGSSPIDTKAPTILRKSSSRISRNSERNSDIYDELETKLPRKPASIASLSPDSLDSGIARTIIDNSEFDESREIKSITRKQSNRISKGSDIFDELESKLPKKRLSNSRLSKSPDSLENSYSKSIDGFDKYFDQDRINKSPVRILQTSMSISTEGFDTLTEAVEVQSMTNKRLSSNTVSKSTDDFNKLNEHDESRPVARKLLLPISKSSDVVSKSSDSLDVIETLTSDDSIERRRSSFEIRSKRGRQAISMSSENFDILNEGSLYVQKRSSASDVNLSRGKRHKLISKSIDSLEVVDSINKQTELNCVSMDIDKSNWRLSSRRIGSSESSDNIELDDKIESRKINRPPKRISNSSRTDIYQVDNYHDNDKKPTLMRKPSRLQKKSESSELGSTDTLNSDKRNKSFDSTETLNSLEKDLDNEKRDINIIDEQNNIEKRDENESWTNSVLDNESPNADGNDNMINQDKPYWRQNSETKENIDIHQLLAMTIVNRIADNGNNQRNNSVQYTGKKLTSPPTSPVTKQEDNKILFNSLLANKNDEDLQNMLNGNISEVSTTTKSFKEKLIMFERLGK